TSPSIVLCTSDPDTDWIIAQHASDNDGYFVSNILKTENSGLSWDTLALASRDLLLVTSLHFIDSEKGFAIGSIPYLDSGFSARALLVTTDGGRTWTQIQEISQPESGVYHPPVQFVNETLGYFLDRMRLYKTMDGGMTFESQGPLVFLRDLYVVDETTIYGTSDSETLLSTDGGQSWEQILDFPATVLRIEGNLALLIGNSENTVCLDENMTPVFQPTWSFVEKVDEILQVDTSSVRGYRLNYVERFPEVTFFRLGSKVLTVR
ncbi:MAG: hypothetical protein AAFY48_04110, partial [Bacteroidota bacterium]